jgi:hypothetical protein
MVTDQDVTMVTDFVNNLIKTMVWSSPVDADLASEADLLGLPIGLAFREVYQQGHAILTKLYEHRTAADPAVDGQAATGIELAVTPSTCKY